ncbi:hypothetical protein CLV63_104197 [Murinocardiopsis flavida]|uniref:Uncharacterized protein n=1 Tax=Murinocardiopsis flavida TaxID=645275 RepID=A0A2P8DP58_9ACTN|nr:hypothetical protein [Murinocardiopsis flavida]PSK98973.1 hypothetical protein CLV63_104197 [Murinocardiopsis flavida]
MSHLNNPARRTLSPHGPDPTPTPLSKEISRGRTETRTVGLFRGGPPRPPGPRGRELTDLARRLDLLGPLRDWLEIRGAFTPAAGLWIHVAPGPGDPRALADRAPLSGGPLAACRITTTVRTVPVGAG